MHSFRASVSKPLPPLSTNFQATVADVTTSNTRPYLSPAILAKRWYISLDAAASTLNVTTQTAVRNIHLQSERKVRIKAPWLQFPSIKGEFYVDSMFSKVTALHGFTGGSIYSNGSGYDRFYPWKRKGEHPDTLVTLMNDVGIPQVLVSDNAKEELQGRARDICRKYHIHQKPTVPYSPWQNAAEASIREVKKNVRRALRRTAAPLRLWSYCAIWCTTIRRLTSSALTRLAGKTPEEFVTGSTPDISALAMFDWYQPVYYWTPTVDFPNERKLLGRWLGIAESCTDDMAFTILTKSGTVITRKSIWGLTGEELRDPTVLKRLKELDDSIQHRIGDDTINVSPPVEDDLLHPGEDEGLELPPDQHGSLELHDVTPEELDEYLSKELLLPRGGDIVKARVLKRTRDGDGIPTGRRHSNPILDTRQYEVEFPDGSIDVYSTNIIAENLYSQVDPESQAHSLFSGIIDHRKRSPKTPGTSQSTKGWELCVQWTDGTSTWLPLKDLRDSNPIETAEYASVHNLLNEKVFKWWARKTLKRRDAYIGKVKTRYWKRTHKYGIEMPKSVADALAIDEETGTNYWRLAIEKEMRNVSPAFEFRDDDTMPPGYTKIDCHMIFDIKIDLTRKARLVAGGHQTEVPKDSVYSSVVSRESVRIALVIATRNGLQVLSADVQNAYLNARTKEKCYAIAGPEFGSGKAGRPVKIVRALYGLRSSGARWRDHLANTIRTLGFKACTADPDVWMRPNTRPSDGFKYWEYILVYVDDLLVVSHDAQSVMDRLSEHYTLKAGSVRPPQEYLGSDIKPYIVPPRNGGETGETCWAMSADTYVERAIADVKRTLQEVGQRLKTKVATPLAANYRPELDASGELDGRRANYYQGLIGILRWIVELGRVDIMVGVSMLSRYLAAPREGHLEQAFHIFAYLNEYDKSTLALSARTPEVDESLFPVNDWTSYYPDAEEAIPPNVPEGRGHPVVVTCYVDADHAGCRVTRRSQTGLIIMVQSAPVIWYSKRQNTVETSTFGSEFIAMKIAVEQVEALRYKLRMMGIPIEGPANLYCDNESVFKNSSFPESAIKKKHNSIAYHKSRESQAAGSVRVAWIPGTTNPADIFTKLLPGPTLRHLVGMILF